MILIYSQQHTARLKYSLQLVLRLILGLDLQLTNNEKEFKNCIGPKLNYSDQKFDDELWIKPNPLLWEKVIKKQTIPTVTYESIPCLFPIDESDLPYDIFAAAFYMASRYEEYLPFEADEHGRFQSNQSILNQLGILKKPIVHIWAKHLLDKLIQKFPDIEINERKFDFEVTIDIDNAWAYKNKGWLLHGGAIGRDLLKANLKAISKRLSVLTGKEKDPYDTYELIEKQFEGLKEKLRFFFLVGNRGIFDKNISPNNKQFKKLIKRLATKFAIGLHPSYASNHKVGLLQSEIKRLEQIVGEAITSSRQHYLKIKFPDTYQELIISGITNDYSLGYADQIGFRAGMCIPFPFFDIEKNTTTGLMIYPLLVMDATLNQYLKLSPEEAIEETYSLLDEVKKVNGKASILWHNESLSNEGKWAGWQPALNEIVQYALNLQNE